MSELYKPKLVSMNPSRWPWCHHSWTKVGPSCSSESEIVSVFPPEAPGHSTQVWTILRPGSWSRHAPYRRSHPRRRAYSPTGPRSCTPERVLAAVVGGLGGWPIAPALADQGKMLPDPVGIADVDTEELGGQSTSPRSSASASSLGAADTNDAVPCTDSFSDSEASLINSHYGTVCIKCGEPRRWSSDGRPRSGCTMLRAERAIQAPWRRPRDDAVMWNDVLDTFHKAPRHR